MSYERFLPESSMNKWMNILESDQSILSFVNKLRSGNYPTRGINKTLDFIKGDGSEERISNAALLTDISEEDIVARYVGHLPLIQNLLENKLTRLETGRVGKITTAKQRQGIQDRIRNEKDLFLTMKKLAENPQSESLLEQTEKFLSAHPKILSKHRKKLLDDFGSSLQGNIPPDFIGNDRKYSILYKLFGKVQETPSYSSNTLNEQLTSTYYRVVPKYRKLIPYELLESDLIIRKAKTYNLSPYIHFLLENQNIVNKLLTDRSLEDRLSAAGTSPDDTKLILATLGQRDIVYTDDYIDSLKEDSPDLYSSIESGLKEFQHEGETYYYFRGRAKLKRLLAADYMDSEVFHDEFSEQMSVRNIRYDSIKDIIEDTPNIEELLTGEVSDTFSLNPWDFFNALMEADQALDLGNLDDLEGDLATKLEKSMVDVRSKLVEITQNKLDDLVANPLSYSLKPFRTGVGEGGEGRKGTTIFEVLENRGIVSGN